MLLLQATTIKAVLFIVICGVWFVGATAGTLYFASPQRRLGYDRQHAVFTYAQAVVFGVLPALGGKWGWSILALPGAVFMATKMIDRRQDANRQDEWVSHHQRSDEQSGR